MIQATGTQKSVVVNRIMYKNIAVNGAITFLVSSKFIDFNTKSYWLSKDSLVPLRGAAEHTEITVGRYVLITVTQLAKSVASYVICTILPLVNLAMT